MKDFSSAFYNELISDSIRPRFCFAGNFGGVWQRYTTHDGDIILNSNTYLGNGYLSSLSAYDESTEIISSGMKVTIAAEPNAIISLFLNNAKNGQKGEIYFVLLNDVNNNIVDSYKIFDGNLDGLTIEDGLDSARAILSYESSLIKLKKATNLRYSDKTQQLFYSGDIGLQYLEQMQNWGGYWGKNAKIESQKNSTTKKNQARRK